MSILYHIGAICVLCAICLPFIMKSKGADPNDKEENDFDERVIYMKDYKYMWRKKKTN